MLDTDRARPHARPGGDRLALGHEPVYDSDPRLEDSAPSIRERASTGLGSVVVGPDAAHRGHAV